jgi:hypothetical protein
VAIIEISCVEVWREVSDYIDDALDAGLRRRIEEHFKGCGHCVAVLDRTRNVIRLVGDRRVFDVPPVAVVDMIASPVGY